MANRLKILSLYKKILTTQQDWFVAPSLYTKRWVEVRKAFKQHKDESSPQRIEALIQDAENYVKEYGHPDPYLSPKAVEGTEWQRNLGVPPGVTYTGPIHKPITSLRQAIKDYFSLKGDLT